MPFPHVLSPVPLCGLGASCQCCHPAGSSPAPPELIHLGEGGNSCWRWGRNLEGGQACEWHGSRRRAVGGAPAPTLLVPGEGALWPGSSRKQLSCEPGAWQRWYGTRGFCPEGAGSLKLSPFLSCPTWCQGLFGLVRGSGTRLSDMGAKAGSGLRAIWATLGRGSPWALKQDDQVSWTFLCLSVPLCRSGFITSSTSYHCED